MSSWPDDLSICAIEHWPLTETLDRSRSPFSAPWAGTLQLLRDELRHADAVSPLLQVCIPESDFGVRGFPLKSARAWSPGVIVSFTGRDGALSFPCDRFLRWEDNLRAIALTMQSLRRINRYGVSRSGEQYQGWRAIESTSSAGAVTSQQAREGLCKIAGVTGPMSDERLARCARAAAHPDRHAGDDTLWNMVSSLLIVLGAAA